MNTSLDDFLCEYFEKSSVSMFEENPKGESEAVLFQEKDLSFRKEKSLSTTVPDAEVPSLSCAGGNSKRTTPTPLSSRTLANFNLGEDNLFEASQCTTVSSEMDFLQDEDKVSASAKVVSIRANRRSTSYDIVFNPARSSPPRLTSARANRGGGDDKEDSHEIVIRIHAREEVGTGTKDKDNVKRLEEWISDLEDKNQELTAEVSSLKGRLEEAYKTIAALELEVASLCCQME